MNIKKSLYVFLCFCMAFTTTAEAKTAEEYATEAEQLVKAGKIDEACDAYFEAFKISSNGNKNISSLTKTDLNYLMKAMIRNLKARDYAGYIEASTANSVYDANRCLLEQIQCHKLEIIALKLNEDDPRLDGKKRASSRSLRISIEKMIELFSDYLRQQSINNQVLQQMQTMYMQSMASMQMPSMPMPPSSFNTYTPQSSTCSYCHGTGLDPSPHQAASYGSMNYDYVYCSICGGTSRSHTHLSCPSCGGRGRR